MLNVFEKVFYQADRQWCYFQFAQRQKQPVSACQTTRAAHNTTIHKRLKSTNDKLPHLIHVEVQASRIFFFTSVLCINMPAAMVPTWCPAAIVYNVAWRATCAGYNNTAFVSSTGLEHLFILFHSKILN